jgi:hypothetical protein
VLTDVGPVRITSLVTGMPACRFRASRQLLRAGLDGPSFADEAVLQFNEPELVSGTCVAQHDPPVSVRAEAHQPPGRMPAIRRPAGVKARLSAACWPAALPSLHQFVALLTELRVLVVMGWLAGRGFRHPQGHHRSAPDVRLAIYVLSHAEGAA